MKTVPQSGFKQLFSRFGGSLKLQRNILLFIEQKWM